MALFKELFEKLDDIVISLDSENPFSYLYNFYNEREEFKSKWLHRYTTSRFLDLYEKYMRTSDNSDSKESKKELSNFIMDNAYYLSSLIIISKVAEEPNNIIFFSNEERYKLMNEFNKRFEDVDPVCYVTDGNKKFLLGLDYSKSYSSGGPKILVIDPSDNFKILRKYIRDFDIKEASSNVL